MRLLLVFIVGFSTTMAVAIMTPDLGVGSRFLASCLLWIPMYCAAVIARDFGGGKAQ